jgi:hypothetical protein
MKITVSNPLPRFCEVKIVRLSFSDSESTHNYDMPPSKAARAGLKILRRAIVIGLGFLVATCFAQDTHPLFDSPGAVLTGFQIAAANADLWATHRNTSAWGKYTREFDPIARPFVMHGTAGEVA